MKIAVWLNNRSPGEAATFYGACARVKKHDPKTLIRGLHSGEALVALAYELDNHSVEHLIIAAHGGPTWILDAQCGLTTGAERFAGQVAVSRLVEAWAPKLTRSPLISLAACMCSRAPSWFLRQRWGYIGSDWGARGYLPGGEASIAARIRDYLIWHGVFPEVRGHRTSGHATYNPILAVHSGHAGEQCRSWWSIENPGKDPTWSERRKWVREKQGQPAEDWLMGR